MQEVTAQKCWRAYLYKIQQIFRQKKHKFSGIKSHFIDKVPVSKTKPVLGLDDILDV